MSKDPVYGVEANVDHSAFDDTYIDKASLGNALMRKVKLAELDWTASEFINSFDVWTLWQQDPFVANKLKNFAYLRCDLVVTIVPACTSFQYGKLMFNYVPYGETNQVYAQAKNQLWTAAAGNDESARREAFKQYMSTYPITGCVDAADNNQVELRLPFIWHRNYIPVAGDSNSSTVSLGLLNVVTLNVLRVANTSTLDNARVALFVHAENVCLHVPTELTATSSKTRFGGNSGKSEIDEAADGVISAPASAVKNVADKLSDVPIIGPFAKATSIGAGAVSSIARLFGFSSPPTTENPDDVNIRLTSNFSTIVGQDSAIPLTFDPKQELTVDPAVIGWSRDDEMSFSSIVTREQFICRGNWNGTHGQFTEAGLDQRVIMCSLVTPNQVREIKFTSDSTAYEFAQNNPAGHLSRVFKYWKGSMKYRFEAVCSKYHSGSLLIQFEPFRNNAGVAIGDILSSTVDVGQPTNLRQSVILNIKENRCAEITVDFIADRNWLENRDNQFTSFAPRAPAQTGFDLHTTFSQRTDAGMIIVSVLNDLVAPADSTYNAGTRVSTFDSPDNGPVQVNMYVSCEADMIFAQPGSGWESDVYVPKTLLESTDEFVATSGQTQWEKSTLLKLDDTTADVSTFFGERVVSLRSLLKRKTLYTCDNPNKTTSAVLFQSTYYSPHFPGQRSGTFLQFDHVLESHFAPCYLAKRGSMRWTFVPINCLVTDGILTNVNGIAEATRQTSSTNKSMNSTSTNAQGLNSATLLDSSFSGYEGMELQNLATKPAIDVQSPFYSGTRFQLACYMTDIIADSNTLSVNPTMDYSLYTRMDIWSVGGNPRVKSYVGTGDDYSLMCYQAPPCIWNRA